MSETPENPLPERSRSSQSPRLVRIGLGLGLLAVLVLLIYLGRSDLGGPPSAVRPIQTDIDNADLTALIDEHVQRVEEARDDAQAHGELGLVYEANDMWVEAGRCFAIAADLDPDEPTWLHHQALTCWNNGDLEAAQALLQENTTRHPDFPASWHRWGYAQLQNDRLDEASQMFERFIQLVPGDPHGYVGLAEVRVKQQQYPQAVELLEKALSLFGEFKMAHYLLGQAYRALGKLDQAKAELALGVDAQVVYWQDPASATLMQYARGFAAMQIRGQQLIGMGQPLQALEIFEGLLAEHPDDTRVMNNLAYTYNLLGRFLESLALLRRAETIDDNALTRMNLSATLLSMNQGAEALASALKAVELAPTLGDAYVAEAKARIVLQQFTEAQAALQAAIGFGSKDPKIHALLGAVYMSQGEFQLAKPHIKQASEEMNTQPAVFMDLIETCLETGDFDEAEAALERLGQLVPGHAVLAELAEKLKARREAP